MRKNINKLLASRASISALFKQVWPTYFRVLRACALPLLFFAIAKDLNIFYNPYVKNIVAYYGLYSICIAFSLYFFCCALCLTHKVQRSEPYTIKAVFSYVLSRMPAVLLIALLVTAGCFLFTHLVVFALKFFSKSPSVVFSIGVISVICVMFVLNILYYSIPLAVLFNNSGLAAMDESMFLASPYIYRTLMLYCIGLLTLYMTSQQPRHAYYLMQYYLNIPFDFIILLLIVPLWLSFSNLIMIDIKNKTFMQEKS